MDLLPTLMEVAGLAVPGELEGLSLLPVIIDAPNGDPDRVLFTSNSYHDVYEPKRAARSLDYAYIRNYEHGPRLIKLAIDLEKSLTRQGMGDAHLAPLPAEELYDRRADPDELQNVVDDPAYESVGKEYADLLREYLLAIHDEVETTPTEPAPARSRLTDPLPAGAEPNWIDDAAN